MMIIGNWPTAFVIVVIVIAICTTMSSIISDIINRSKPISRHCVRCNKEIEEEAEHHYTRHVIPGWQDDN